MIFDDIFDIFSLFVDFASSWRLWICAVVFIGLAILFHTVLGDGTWVYFFSIPTGLAGVIGGIFWELKAAEK